MKLFSKKFNIDKNNLPKCVAFIIDGNGRWAKKRGLPRMLGHRAGIDAVKKTIDYAESLGLQEVMFYCFSTENWNRPKNEVDGLFDLFRDFVNNQADDYLKRNFMFKLIGDKTKIPKDIVKKVDDIEEKTKNCTKMKVGLCINYGGKFDILNAVNNILKSGKTQVTEKDFESYLLTKDFSNPDLIIRTSGEQRLSNFLLYQMAYSELYFTKTYWPDFDKKSLEMAIYDYQKRNRRFGAIKE
jgi:undecaprenyl diphosphate synthase